MVIEAFMENKEFHQLAGYLDNLVSFSAESITEPTRAIKTGARHARARYLLLPSKVRKSFKTDTHDFERIRCNCLENGSKLFIIFALEKKA